MKTFELPTDKFTVNKEDLSIDFTNFADFDPSLLQSVFVPKSNEILYRNPAYILKRFEWVGKKLILKRQSPVAYFGQTGVRCLYISSED